MLRFGLWAATPFEPRTAFSFGFLQWVEAAMLSCHVSVHSFVEAVRFKNNFSEETVCMLSWLLYLFVLFRFLLLISNV